MRLFKSLMALLFIAFGVAFGALNRAPVHVDLGYRTLELSLGLALLTVLLLGALLGGLAVMAGVVWPMRRRSDPSGSSGTEPDAGEPTGGSRSP